VRSQPFATDRASGSSLVVWPAHGVSIMPRDRKKPLPGPCSVRNRCYKARNLLRDVLPHAARANQSSRIKSRCTKLIQCWPGTQFGRVLQKCRGSATGKAWPAVTNRPRTRDFCAPLIYERKPDGRFGTESAEKVHKVAKGRFLRPVRTGGCSGTLRFSHPRGFDTTSKCADPKMQTLRDVGAGLAGRVGVVEAEGAERRVPDQTGAEGRTDLLRVCNGQRLRQ
jgi:hypothetical protein